MINVAARRELCEKSVTLDGKPARIAGAFCSFATVASLDGKLRGEWSWDAVRRIVVEKNGAFAL